MKTRFLGALRAVLTVATMFGVVSVATLPVAAQAQARALPDFTDLVEQVGPSVVNIRTSEKVVTHATQGAPNEEEMLDFFRRFGLPVPNLPKQAPRKNQPQQPQQHQQHQQHQ